MAKKVKRVVSRVRDEGQAVTPFVCGWHLTVGKDGAQHCKPYGDAPRHMRAVGKEWRPDTKSVREMERRRLGKIKGGTEDVKEEVCPLAALPTRDEN